MTSNQVVVLLVVLALIGVYALPLLAAFWSSRQEAKKLLATGAVAEAEVLGYKSIEGMWVQYRFFPEGSDTEVVCDKHLIRGGKKLPIGSKTPVRYKKNFPQISVLVVYANSQAPS